MSGNQTNQENKSWFVNSDGDVVNERTNLLIADVNYLTREGYKNAALIAAAPELLAACKYALEVFKDVDLGDCNQADGDARRMLFNAIAKAQGV